MGLKDEIVDKLAETNSKEKIRETLSDHREDIRKALYLNSAEKGVFDAVQERVISRKLLVFGVATVLLYFNVGLDADTWGMIAMCYIGGQTAIDFAKVWKG